jgi:hypothetical protein
MSGCAVQGRWDDYASKTETMKVFTFVPCDGQVYALPEHQTYYHIWHFSTFSVDRGSYWIAYQVSKDKSENHTIYFSFVKYVGLQHYTAITVAKPAANERGAKCAALAVLPWTEGIERPFFIPAPLPKLTAEAQNKLWFSAIRGGWVFLGLVLTAHLARRGFLEGEVEGEAICRVLLVCLFIANIAYWSFAVGADWYKIQLTLPYYSFFDSLPHTSLGLLPLSWAQAHMLFEGPPYPPIQGSGNTDYFFLGLGLSCAVWLVAYARRILIGISYLFMPDPLEAARDRLSAAGQIPTAEDYLDALAQAAARMTTEELQILKHKISERMRDA